MTAQVDERVLRACHAAARRVTRIHRGAVEHDDILSAVYMWVATHGDKIEEWAGEGRAGQGKLAKSLYRAGQRYAVRERHRASGIPVGDVTWYTRGLLEELLPDVWDYDNWALARRGVPSSTPRGKSRLSEGNGYLAMLIDVKGAVDTLPVEDQRVLRERYERGSTVEEVAEATGLSENTVVRRINRALEKLTDRLGGEPPVWGAGRKARSNTQAQAEVAL